MTASFDPGKHPRGRPGNQGPGSQFWVAATDHSPRARLTVVDDQLRTFDGDTETTNLTDLASRHR